MKYRVERTDGTAIPEDEPCFVIRATDIFAVPMLSHYYALSYGASEEFADEVYTHYRRILDWQRANREKVKIPD